MNPVTGKDNSLTGVGSDRPDVASLTAYTGAPHGKLYQYVNPKLFNPNALGTFGNAGHNSLRGPGYFDLDLALSREFKLYEQLTLGARVEAFNLLNHTNRLRVSPYYTSTFGALVEAQNPRQVQLMFQFEY